MEDKLRKRETIGDGKFLKHSNNPKPVIMSKHKH